MAEDNDGKRHLPIVDGPIRNDLDDGLRFVHVLNMQVKNDLFDTTTKLSALIEELVARGQIDAMALAERRERIRAREQERQKKQAHIQVADLEDKYSLANLPDIDCDARLSLCKARCCTLYFTLSFQDLDEGKIEWDYALPYVIRRRPDGYCVHADPTSLHCTAYEHRPAACRKYDCRTDKRIWIDFEKRIPAP